MLSSYAVMDEEEMTYVKGGAFTVTIRQAIIRMVIAICCDTYVI